MLDSVMQRHTTKVVGPIHFLGT